jgi:hypothetical protein
VLVKTNPIRAPKEELTWTKGPTSLQFWSSGTSVLANNSDTCRGRLRKIRAA